jgi:hypothetical protein
MARVQLVKKIAYILFTGLTGCAMPATYTQPMNSPFIVANQTAQLTQGVIGPNNFSSNVNNGLLYYLNGMSILQNPWNLQAYIR